MRLEMQSSSGNILLIIIIAAVIVALILWVKKYNGSPQKRLRRLRKRYIKFNVKHVPVEETKPEANKETEMKPLLREQPNTQKPTSSKKEKSVVYWIIALPLLIFVITCAVYLLSGDGDDDNDAYRMGLKGDVAAIYEKSVYYEDGYEVENADNGLFDGNAFLAGVFGDEHGARLPFNYLLFYSTNVSLSFNEQGNVETLVSNSQDGGVITFQYDAAGNLVRQDARNQGEDVIRYRDNQIIEGRHKGMLREKTHTGKIILRKDGEYVMYAEIELDKNNRLKRLYLPGYWGKSSSGKKASYAEYIFEYNADGWPTRIISSTGKEGYGQIVTTFSYRDYDNYDDHYNWTERTAEVEWRRGEERMQFWIKTSRDISYRVSWLEKHFPSIYWWFY